MNLNQRARGQWSAIYSAIAPELAQATESRKHVPCPVHGGNDGFRLFTDWQESGGGVCSTCGNFCNGVDLLMWLLDADFKDVANRIEEVIGSDSDRKPDPELEQNKLRLRKTQESATRAGEAVSAYLSARGLETPPSLFEAVLPYWNGSEKVGQYPAMLAKFVSASGQPVTWHVTYLDGPRKANVDSPRKIMTPIQPMAGGAIRLYPHGETLGIAEGIETAIAAKMLFDVPVWAAMNAQNLEKFKPPKGVKRLFIFGDNDHSHAGQASAHALARRVWNRIEWREVRIPAYPADWNDVLINQQQKAA